MLLIGSGLLNGFLNEYTFMFASIFINVVVGFNYRKEILSGCHCSFSNNIKDMIITCFLLFLLSFGVVILTADIFYSLAHILFYEKPDPLKTHHINLFVTLAVVFSNMIFKTVVTFLNRKGGVLVERFLAIKGIVTNKNKEEK